MASSPTKEVQTKSFDETLIDLVRANPLLYEKGKRVKPYETLNAYDIWKSIGTSLGKEAIFCIERWKSLRDRYFQKVGKSKSDQTVNDDWYLLEKMRFLDKNLQHHHHRQSKKLIDGNREQIPQASTSSAAIAQEIFGGINYEEPLQEAMDDQPLASGEVAKKSSELPMPSQTETIMTTGINSSVLQRIETLLGGLDLINRNIAEKRILSYLCKCQLKALEGGSIEDIVL